ncbi:MAG: alpha/beta hydrolase [Thiothrix sp.]|nr:alpha/beta hydrolase [Thiothrix sp.]
MRLMVRSRDDVTTGRLQPLQQAAIRFTTSHDRVRLAWTASGSGLPMLKAPSWISNIELEACSLIFTEFYRWLGERVQLVRFDQRGTSLSDRVEGILRIDDMVEDMRAVADAAGLERFLLFGPSQGVAFAIAFAHRYPERVLGIIGQGGFGRGWLTSGKESERSKYRSSKTLIEAGWDDNNPEYRRFFTCCTHVETARSVWMRAGGWQP